MAHQAHKYLLLSRGTRCFRDLSHSSSYFHSVLALSWRHLLVIQLVSRAHSILQVRWPRSTGQPLDIVSRPATTTVDTWHSDAIIMFRRLSHTLPRDPVFPADLEKLGFFVNDQDQIRMIKSPEQKYQYSINKNDRVNDLYKEAMNSQWMLMLCPPVYFVMLIHRCTACVRNIVLERLLHLGFEILRLPVGVPESENHVPILVSKDLRSKKRVVVLFGERNKDLGIFSYRVVGEEGIKVGSILDFVEAVLFGPTLTSDHDTPGVVITNPGQLLWYRGGSRAVTHSEWLSLPREYAVYEAFRIDPIKNTIPGNRDFREHVSYVFDHVLAEMIQPTALLDIIGLEYTGSAALEYLADHCEWPSITQ